MDDANASLDALLSRAEVAVRRIRTGLAAADRDKERDLLLRQRVGAVLADLDALIADGRA